MKLSKQINLPRAKLLPVYILAIAFCWSFFSNATSFGKKHYRTTYEKFLAQAQTGDSKAQNFLGYMHFYGEGAPLDYEKARHWFEVSAKNGEVRAQRNLGLFYARSLKRIPKSYLDTTASNFWLTMAEGAIPAVDFTKLSGNYADNIEYLSQGNSFNVGRKIYQGYCAGCHGYQGIASYKQSPSFANGERLHKNDQRLLLSISAGKNNMPAWGQLLSKQHQQDVLSYIRKAFNSADLKSANKTSNPINVDNDLGAKTFAMFCAGCHGFNGIAYYVNSPSFALGERMNKSNARLLRSVKNGLNIMPGWSDKLSPRQLSAVVKYIRILAVEFDVGIDREIHKPASRYYIFKPK